MEREEKSKNKSHEVDYIFSKTITAGKRIYYVDVKQNRKGELFLIITESKKILDENDAQNVYFEKHKIFLYKEEFEKFTDALNQAMQYIKNNNTVDFVPHKEKEETEKTQDSIDPNIRFDDVPV
ncbi:MAG: PUR family DNA/RNA-binding protein [Dysgonamonadaceae bacterium]|jgi:rhamnose utilization protein RhaD (predicted bifunctional aldolase and dehydrogenase)|nr:PUR family DNA/RNA-binding protein [Dysgonamonadaceae bacterium]